MTCSCSHWWHAPFYLTVSILLAAIAIYSFPPPPSTTATTTLDSITQPSISFSNSFTTALHSNGYTIMATLLQFSPQLFFLTSPHPSSTVFALHDTVFSNFSATPYTMQLLLQYHTLPLKLTFQELLEKHNFSCLPTLVPSKNLSLTRIIHHGDSNHSVVMINDIAISHPNLFLEDFISIHGVLHPFTSPLNHRNNQEDVLVNSPYCVDFIGTNKTNFPNHSMNNMNNTSQHAVEWVRMIRTLSSTGYISFAIGLNSVLNRVINDNLDLGPVTVLAPLDFGFVGSSNWLLDRIVRYHVLSQRYNYSELAALPTKSVLNTLLPGSVLEVTVSLNANVSHRVAVNGVDIVLSEIFSTQMFIVHGISRALDFLDRASTGR